jgi:hypothetical protein
MVFRGRNAAPDERVRDEGSVTLGAGFGGLAPPKTLPIRRPLS